MKTLTKDKDKGFSKLYFIFKIYSIAKVIMEKLKSQKHAPFSKNSLFRHHAITTSKSKLIIYQ